MFSKDRNRIDRCLYYMPLLLSRVYCLQVRPVRSVATHGPNHCHWQSIIAKRYKRHWRTQIVNANREANTPTFIERKTRKCEVIPSEATTFNWGTGSKTRDIVPSNSPEKKSRERTSDPERRVRLDTFSIDYNEEYLTWVDHEWALRGQIDRRIGCPRSGRRVQSMTKVTMGWAKPLILLIFKVVIWPNLSFFFLEQRMKGAP